MKIGIDIRNIGKKRTGDEVVFFNVTKELATLDAKNEYRLFTDITDGETLQKIKADLGIKNKNNFQIVSLSTHNKFSWNFWTLQRELRKNPVDIYLTQYITPFFVPKKIKIATIIHDISFNFYPQFIKWSDLFFLKTLIPLSLRRADKIIGVSRFTRDEIIKYYKIGRNKVDFIHNAAADDFRQLSEGTQNISEEKIKSVKEKYNLPEKYILYIGTLQPRKNLPVLIEAFSEFVGTIHELSLQGRDIKLVIAGGKGHNYDKRIDNVIKRYNAAKNVSMPGFIDEEDKATLVAGAEIFCLPSLYEGFGIPILEAMSAGVPVVASDIAPHREIAKGAAVFFNPEIPGELEQKLKELIANKNLRGDLAQKGKEQARKFSWKKTAVRLTKILFSVE